MNVPIATEYGVFQATFSSRGLVSLQFPRDKRPPSSSIANHGCDCEPFSKWATLTGAALRQVLAGKAPGELPPLDLSGGTVFQRQVWKALQAIPIGGVSTYAGVARTICKPAATRAVGNACGRNPIPVIIPCHRVLAQGGRLGGFSAGLHWKRVLLAAEGVQVAGA